MIALFYLSILITAVLNRGFLSCENCDFFRCRFQTWPVEGAATLWATVTAEEEEVHGVVMTGASLKRSDDGDHVENMMVIRAFSVDFHVSLFTFVCLWVRVFFPLQDFQGLFTFSDI